MRRQGPQVKRGRSHPVRRARRARLSRFARLFAVALAAALWVAVALPAMASTTVVLKGHWRYSGTQRGVRVRASGPLKLRLNPTAGTFTCICYGTSTANGTTRIEGHAVHIKGASTARAIACSGTLRGASLGGVSLRGTMRFKHATSAVYTIEVPRDGAVKTVRKKIRSHKDFPATIRGSVRLGTGGSGTIIDDERMVWTWQVGGSDEGMTEPAPPEPAPPEPAQESGEHPEKLSDQLKDVKDPAQKRRIVGDFLKAKKAATNKAVRKFDKTLKNIRRKHDFNNGLDNDAAQLGDDVKGKLDAGKRQIVDKMQEKGWRWMKKKTNPAAKVSGLVGKIKDKFDRAKEIYNEVKQVKESVDRINRKVKNGSISKDRGRVLKGGTMLGKALSKVLGWLPVFGSTASKVTDKTFGAAMRAGEKIATHYTKTDCCINDPLADCCL